MDLDLDHKPESPLAKISSKASWDPQEQELSELKPMFEESKKKGEAGIGTVLKCLRNLKAAIDSENRSRELEKMGASYARPDADINTQGHRMKALHKLERKIKDSKLAPTLAELPKLWKRRTALDNFFHDLGKDPAFWEVRMKPEEIRANRKELDTIEEKINHIETSPEYAEMCALEDAKNKQLWEETVATLNPEEKELLQVSSRIQGLEETFHAIHKNGDWRHEAQSDGSYAQMSAELSRLRELDGTPEHEAVLEKVRDTMEKLSQTSKSSN